MDDFESGALTGWKAVGSGSGGWFVYTDGKQGTRSRSERSQRSLRSPGSAAGQVRGGDRHERSRNAHPVPGREAGRSLHAPPDRLLRRGRRFHAARRPSRTTGPSPTSSSGSTSSHLSAPIDSVAKEDVLVNIFATVARRSGPPRADRRQRRPVSRWAGQTVRLRLAGTDNSGPLRAGVDDIRFEPIGSDASGPDRASGHPGAGTRPESRPFPAARPASRRRADCLRLGGNLPIASSLRGSKPSTVVIRGDTEKFLEARLPLSGHASWTWRWRSAQQTGGFDLRKLEQASATECHRPRAGARLGSVRQVRAPTRRSSRRTSRGR